MDQVIPFTGVVGLDQAGVPAWTAWCRPFFLALLAHAELAVPRSYAQGKEPHNWGTMV